jgi:hypothetical protein
MVWDKLFTKGRLGFWDSSSYFRGFKTSHFLTKLQSKKPQSGNRNITCDGASLKKLHDGTWVPALNFSRVNFPRKNRVLQEVVRSFQKCLTKSTMRVGQLFSRQHTDVARSKNLTAFDLVSNHTKANPPLGPTGSLDCSMINPTSKKALLHESSYGGIDFIFLLCLSTILLLAHIAGTAWLLRRVEAGWRLFDDEQHSPLYCLSADNVYEGLQPSKIIGLNPDIRDDISYECLPQRLDHAAPHRKEQAWPEAICVIIRRLKLLQDGDHRCA